MADKKISQLPAATTPLAGTEVLPIVQSSTTDQVSVANLTAGRAVSAASFVPTGSTKPTNGMYLPTTDTIAISTANANAIYINSSNRVGIGAITTVYADLQVKQSSAGVNGFYVEASATNNQVRTYHNGNEGGISVTYGSSGAYKPLVLSTSDTARVTVAAAGDVTVNTGNLVIGTSGKGIDFSATASGSGTMTSELFSDYEEGTWTPTVGGTWTSNPTSLSGTYTKVGRMVQVNCSFTGGTKAAATDGWIGGLPYSVQSEGTGVVVDSAIVAYGNCLAANSTRIWLTTNSFGAGAKYITLTYMV